MVFYGPLCTFDVYMLMA